MFTAPNGDPLAPERLTRLFHRLVTEHGLPPIRLHDLRHGAATLALAAAVELKVVQDLLGHSSIVLTTDTYTSVLPEVAHRAAEKTAKHVLKAVGWCPALTGCADQIPAAGNAARPTRPDRGVDDASRTSPATTLAEQGRAGESAASVP